MWPHASTAGPAWLTPASSQHPATSRTSAFKGNLCSPLHANLMLTAAFGLLQHGRVRIFIIWPYNGALQSMRSRVLVSAALHELHDSRNGVCPLHWVDQMGTFS